ncbi:MAG: hypothetical protein HYZ54_00415 [Ignavibacteriae bacterium]|nr:hypothetical protein [Ignavibacteriota bacterium]
MKTKQVAVTLMTILLSSCSLFSTRDPEDPTSVRSTFIPPTSPATVIANFKSAIAEKNTENFVSCFSDTSRGGSRVYVFEPSAAVSSQFPSVFQLWNISSERQSFLAMLGKLPTDVQPILQLNNPQFTNPSPDSAVYEADYVLIAKHTVQTIPTEVAGYMRLTIAVQTSGLWSIIRWTDSSPSQPDSINATWSLLKAKFSN